MSQEMIADKNLDELNIEEIAKISNVIGSDSGFIASDNLDSDTFLSRDYIDSIENLKIGTPFKMRFTMMLFCISGKMNIQINLVSHTLNAGEMLIVHEGTITTGLSMDPTIRLFIMGFTSSFIGSFHSSRMSKMDFTKFLDTSVIKLRPEDMNDIFSIYKVINNRLRQHDFTFKNEMIWFELQAIECILADELKDNHPAERSMSRKQIIIRDFLLLVGKYATKQREISFYARQLCISPKYLGQVVTELSGETPHKWICRQVILEAKALLADHNLTIQQISEALNFTNQSFFGTFFRQHTGISPKAYRSGNLQPSHDN